MTNYSTVIDHLVNLLEKEVLRVQDDLGTGSAKSYEIYTERVGYLSGLKFCISELLDIEKRLDNS